MHVLGKLFGVGHVDPLCIMNEKYSELVIHVDPLCMFYEKCSELVMWTLYACLIKYIQSWSCGPSVDV